MRPIPILIPTPEGEKADGSKTVSVVIPVYYNAESLPVLFESLLDVERALAERGCALELIFVDDGSGDRSVEVLLALKARRPATRIVKLARNFGAIHSSKVGLFFVTGGCFMWLAADLQDPPHLIVEMAEHWLCGAQYVVAVRASREDPAMTRLFARFYYRLVRLFVLPNYPRGGFDIILMDAALMPYIRDSSKNINTSLLSYWLGVSPVTIEYHRPERQFGKSRWTFGKKVNYFIDSMLGFSIVPIRLISAIGGLVAVASFLYGLYIVFYYAFIEPGSEVQGFPTLVALLTFLLGLIIFMLGVIGEYIWRIFDEVTLRPEAVIEKVY
jgi:dolichol-phosphate mannosyltransferase